MVILGNIHFKETCMKTHIVKAEKRSGDLKKEDQLAWKIAVLAAKTKDSDLPAETVDMIKNRIIDNAAIALAAANEYPVAVARDKALATRGTGKATIYGLPQKETFAPKE